jgi:hypothetical protein
MQFSYRELSYTFEDEDAIASGMKLANTLIQYPSSNQVMHDEVPRRELVRKTLFRNACSRVLTPSLGSASMRLDMLCVATIGMHFGCRDNDKKFTAPMAMEWTSRSSLSTLC